MIIKFLDSNNNLFIERNSIDWPFLPRKADYIRLKRFKEGTERGTETLIGFVNYTRFVEALNSKTPIVEILISAIPQKD